MSNDPILPRDVRERERWYMATYQAVGELMANLPDPDTAFCHTLVPDDRPEAITGEFFTYNAAYHALLTVQDALAALVNITNGTP